MSERPRDLWARLVGARAWVVAALVVTALSFLSQVPSLRVRFAPEELVAPDDQSRLDADLLDAHFGDEGEAVVLLVRGEDVLSLSSLTYLHQAARALEGVPGVDTVVAPSTLRLPRRTRAVPVEGETLEALDTLDSVPAPDALDPRLAALSEIALAHPGRFPLGLVTLANEGTSFEVVPFVRGDVPTEEERQALVLALGRSPLLRGRLVSESRHVAVVAAMLAPRADDEVVAQVLSAAGALLDDAPEGLEVELTGLPAIRAEMIAALRADQMLLVTLAAVLSFLVLVVGLRSVAGVVLPFGTVGITVAITVGAMAMAGEPINLLTNMIPPLLLTIGLAEAVHMVLRWEEEVERGLTRFDAAVETLRHLWLPCFVTTFTTALGFGALVLQETAILRRFGLIAGLASMLAYVVTIAFVPAMLPSMQPRAKKRGQKNAPSEDFLERAMVRIARVTSAEWRVTLAVSTLLLIFAAVFARDIEVDSRLMDQFARGSEVARATRLLETELDGVRSLDIEVTSEPGRFFDPAGLEDVDALAAHLRAQPGVLRVTTAADWLREIRSTVLAPAPSPDAPTGVGSAEETAVTMNDGSAFASPAEVRGLVSLSEGDPEVASPLTRYLTADGGAARLEVRLADRGASRILSMLDGLESVAVARGLTVHFSGEAYDASRGLDRIVRSLGSLGAAIVMIFLAMTLLFRSLRLGLLSIPPNALPLVLTLAYMVARGIPLHAATVIVFTVTVGLSVDGATHVIARFQEEAANGLGAREVVLRTVRSSGRGVVLSSATLLLGYTALLFSAFEPVRLFGELSAVAIGGSLIAQIVLLPALLAAFAMPASVEPASLPVVEAPPEADVP